jgi:carboxylate-amine ligase
VTIADDIRTTLDQLAPHAAALGSTAAFEALAAEAGGEGNEAAWLRRLYGAGKTLPDVVREQAARWMNP